MALSIRDKLFITDTVRYSGALHAVEPTLRIAGGEARGRGAVSRLSKPIFGISFGKHNVLRALFMGSIRNLSAGDPALHSHTPRTSTMRCRSRYTNRKVPCHLLGPRLIGYKALIHRKIRLISKWGYLFRTTVVLR